MTSPMRMTLQVLTTAVLVTSLAGDFGRDVVQFHQDSGTHHQQQTHFRPHDSSRGYVGDCNGGYYNISWTPKDVSPASAIVLKAGVVSPIDIDQVHIVGSVMYEQTKMLAIDRVFSCRDMSDNIANIFPYVALKCPIKKGELLCGSFLYTDTERLIGIDGDFQLKGTVYDMKGKGHFCVEVSITVLPYGDP